MISQNLGRLFHDDKLHLVATELMKNGCDLVAWKTHLKFRHLETGKVVIMPKSPSDCRSWKNVVAKIKHQLNIDLAPAVNGRNRKKK